MATVSARIAAGPQDVWAALADGWYYSNWVVGTSHVRAVDASWPAVGAHLHHATGAWPLVFRDETEVLASEPGQLLALVARGRPFGEAEVTLTLTPVAGGTDVVMTEAPTSGPGRWLHNPLADAVLHRRNTESLARLDALVRRRTSP